MMCHLYLSFPLSALRSAHLPVNLIGAPINYANGLIGSPITSQSAVPAVSGPGAAGDLGRGERGAAAHVHAPGEPDGGGIRGAPL